MIALLAFVLAASAQDPARGEYVARAAGCVACHTVEGGAPYAGGYALHNRFGTFYGSNLTPDPATGIGSWTEDDFARAVREGRGPDGKAYWPTFPYPSFTLLTDGDLRDLYAFFRTVEPVERVREPNEIRKRVRGLLGSWRTLEFHEGPYEPDPDRDPEWNRGAYLVRAVAHCAQCHTPRNGISGLREKRELAGSDVPDEEAPNITPHEDGIGGWTMDDLETFLTVGMKPDGDVVSGVMAEIVEDQTATLTPEDRRAIAVYLLAVRPLPSRTRTTAP